MEKPLLIVQDTVDSSKTAQAGDSIMKGANGRGVRGDLQGAPDLERIERRISELDETIRKAGAERLKLLQARVTNQLGVASAPANVAGATALELEGDRRAKKDPPKPPKRDTIPAEVKDGDAPAAPAGSGPQESEGPREVL
jgi:hypothetical protein